MTARERARVAMEVREKAEAFDWLHDQDQRNRLLMRDRDERYYVYDCVTGTHGPSCDTPLAAVQAAMKEEKGMATEWKPSFNDITVAVDETGVYDTGMSEGE